MFEVMERQGLYPPELNLVGGTIFTVTLRNTPVYDEETLQWLQQFDHLGLSGNQKRLLAYAKSHESTFTSKAYQKLVGVDIYTAARDIKDLIRRGMVRRTKKGGRVYQIVEPTQAQPVPIPEEFQKMLPILHEQQFVRNQDVRKALSLSRLRATRLLQQWVSLGLLKMEGRGRGTRYIPVENESI